MGDKDSVPSEIMPGDFPFPLTKGPEESPYLTWLRNHSNYMASRGFLDYLRAVGVLLQGILINFLIVLSLLLVVSLVIGHLYGNGLRERNAPSTAADPIGDDQPTGDLVEVTAQLWSLNDLTQPAIALQSDFTSVNAVGISPDSQWVVAASDDGMARLWKLGADGVSQEPVLLEGHGGPVVAVAFSPDNQWLATASFDGTARLWNLNQPRPSQKPVALEGHTDWITAVAFSPDSRWLATGSDDMTARLWNLAAPDPSRDPELLKGHADWITAVAFGPDSRWLATASDDSTVRLWDIDEKEQKSVLKHESSILALAIGSQWLATGSSSERPTPGLLTKLKDSTSKWLKNPQMPPLFVLTVSVLGLFLAFVLLSPVVILLGEIVGQRKSMKRPGSDSSVGRRDRFERAFGFALLLILGVAFFEALPALVYQFHKLRVSSMPWNAVFTSMTAVSVAVMGGAGRLLSVLGGAKKQLAMLLIGLLGLLAPLIVVLYITDYVVFGPPADSKTWLWLGVLPVLGWIGGGLAVLFSFRASISMWERVRMFGPPFVVFLALSIVVIDSAIDGEKWSSDYHKATQPQSRKLIKLANGLARLSDVDDEAASKPDNLYGELDTLAEQFLKSEQKRMRRAAEFAVGLEKKLANANPEEEEGIRNALTGLAGKEIDRQLATLRKLTNQKALQDGLSDLASSRASYTLLSEKLKALAAMAAKATAKELGQLQDMLYEIVIAAELASDRDELGYLQEDITYLDSFSQLTSETTQIANLKQKLAEILYQLEEILYQTDSAKLADDQNQIPILQQRLAKLTAELTPYEWVNGQLNELAKLAAKPDMESVRYRLYDLINWIEQASDPAARESLRGNKDYLVRLNELAVELAPDQAQINMSRQLTELADLAGERNDTRILQQRLEEFLSQSDWARLAVRASDPGELDELRQKLEELLSQTDWANLADQASGPDKPGELQQRLTELAFDSDELEKLQQELSKLRDQALDPNRLESLKERLAELATKMMPLSELAKAPDRAEVRELADRFLRLPQSDRLGLDQTDKLELSYLAGAMNREFPVPDYAEDREQSELTKDFVNGLLEAGQKAQAEHEKPSGSSAKLAFGPLAELPPGLFEPYKGNGPLAQKSKVVFLVILAFELWLFCWLLVDVNRTSIHGLYRDRLASAYLVGRDTKGDIGIEEDINLGEICCYEAKSTAPYHLLNVALNLQGSQDISIRDRNSDFFIFSKRFVGGHRTGYARSATIERVHPQMGLATAMAISAAAASPNMGRGTNPALVAFMVLLNIRLGYWIPNPGLLEAVLSGNRLRSIRKKCRQTGMVPGFTFEDVFQQELNDIKLRWEHVYRNTAEHRNLDLDGDRPPVTPTTRHELVGLCFSGGGIRSATINLGIVEVLYKHGVFDHVDYMSTVSGGGYLGSSISTLMRERTKTLSDVDGNVSVQQDSETGEQIVRITRKKPQTRKYPFLKDARLAIEEGDRVRAGQLLGTQPGLRIRSEIEGVVSIVVDGDNKTVRVLDKEREYRYTKYTLLDEDVVLNKRVKRGDPLIRPSGRLTRSEIAGQVSVETNKGTGEKIVKVTPRRHGAFAGLQARFGKHGNGEMHEPIEPREYRFSKYDALRIRDGGMVAKGESLIHRHNSLLDRFRWRVKPAALVREMSMRLDECHKWVNLSDGGHIENLGGMELLRRRCKFIIIGDGEADPKLTFNGLATLMRFARIDLGVRIDIDPGLIRVNKNKQAIDEGKDNLSMEHWASGKITYPPNDSSGKEETGYLLYLKSSCTGDEDEVIQEYRQREPTFPHQSTADQFFDEDQFECYRALGQHIAEKAFERGPQETAATWPMQRKMSFADLRNWFESLEAKRPQSSEDSESFIIY